MPCRHIHTSWWLLLPFVTIQPNTLSKVTKIICEILKHRHIKRKPTQRFTTNCLKHLFWNPNGLIKKKTHPEKQFRLYLYRLGAWHGLFGWNVQDRWLPLGGVRQHHLWKFDAWERTGWPAAAGKKRMATERDPVCRASEGCQCVCLCERERDLF